jgi:hypothetical protein
MTMIHRPTDFILVAAIKRFVVFRKVHNDDNNVSNFICPKLSKKLQARNQDLYRHELKTL